jgi:hypothetical protein
MSLLEIAALVRRHLFAVVTICILATSIAYGLEHKNPGYQDSGTVAVASTKIENKLWTYPRSLLAVEELLNVYIGGPQGERGVLAAGGRGDYSVTLDNVNNEELPYYKYPYLNIATSAGSTEAARTTYSAVIEALTKELASLQGDPKVPASKLPAVTLTAQPGTLTSLRGSRVRSLSAVAVLTILAAIMSAYAFDRRGRQRPSLSLTND